MNSLAHGNGAAQDVLLYGRNSTDDQAEAGTIQNQQDFLRNFAHLMRLNVVGEFWVRVCRARSRSNSGPTADSSWRRAASGPAPRCSASASTASAAPSVSCWTRMPPSRAPA